MQIRLWLIFGSVILLTACGETQSEPPPQNTVVRVDVTPLGNFVEGCTTELLDEWYQVTSTNATRFRTMSEQNATIAENQGLTVVNDLGDLRSQITQLTPPECVAEPHQILRNVMQVIIQTYLSYYKGEISQETLQERLVAQHEIYDTVIVPVIDDFRQQLESQYANSP